MSSLKKLIGRTVEFHGWLVSASRRISKNTKFMQLRQPGGELIQLIDKRPPEQRAGDAKTNCSPTGNLPAESVVRVRGLVCKRPLKDQRPGQECEVEVQDIELLNAADSPLPFNPLQPPSNILTCLRHRHLYLRSPLMQKNLRLRSELSYQIHSFFHEHEFCEVETPLLFKSTPEGAREFLVPSRHDPGCFYALTQSPQQIKQTLMASGFHRYYQFARCFRDEDLRADRQIEFTQIDMEMAFVYNREQVMSVVEALIRFLWKRVLGLELKSFPRLTYKEALARYGTDKPDLRHDTSFKCLNEILQLNLQNDVLIEAFLVKQGGHHLSESFCKTLKHNSKQKLNYIHVKNENIMHSWSQQLPETKLMPHETTRLNEFLGLEVGDIIFVSSRPSHSPFAMTALGEVYPLVHKALTEMKVAPKLNEHEFAFTWIVDFPLVTPDASNPNAWKATHHPFTAPHPEDIHLLQNNPLDARALSYDLVVNGIELGGGSIRIHDYQQQYEILRDVLKLTDTEIRSFEHLFTILRSGCPPHGGFALGYDRLVALMAGCRDIRDVIAFPKTASGKDLLFQSPGPVSSSQLTEYKLQLQPSNAV